MSYVEHKFKLTRLNPNANYRLSCLKSRIGIIPSVLLSKKGNNSSRTNLLYELCFKLVDWGNPKSFPENFKKLIKLKIAPIAFSLVVKKVLSLKVLSYLCLASYCLAFI